MTRDVVVPVVAGVFLLAAAVAFTRGSSDDGVPEPLGAEPLPAVVTRPNILLVLADDLGVDQMAAYGAPDSPPTPRLDALAAQGLRFDRVWAYAMCTPSRASLLTGTEPSEHGFGHIIRTTLEADMVDVTGPTLPRTLAGAGYATSLVGKWHLVGRAVPSAGTHPQQAGFGWASGPLGNLNHGLAPTGGLDLGYETWEVVTNGVPSLTRDYATTRTTDDAIARMQASPEPWFIWTAYNAPHVPLHVPPAHLHTRELSDRPSDLERFGAMVEALDTEVGRLLDAIPEPQRSRTLVVFLSDNGTPKHGIVAPYNPARSKGTLFEGGIRVPLVMATADGSDTLVKPGVTDALVHVTDLLPTFAGLAGLEASPSWTGTSFEEVLRGGAGSRTHLFSEKFVPNGEGPRERDHKAARTARHKRVKSLTGAADQLYTFVPGALDEGEPIPPLRRTRQDERAYEALAAAMEQRWPELAAQPPSADEGDTEDPSGELMAPAE